MPTKNYYVVLGVSRRASPSGIRAAYHELARRMHPDIAGPTGTSRFQEINEAYEVLSDPARRRAHDREFDEPNRAIEVPVRQQPPRWPISPEPISITNVFGDDIYILMNNRQGGFQLAQTINISGGGSMASFSDVNGDGKMDVIITGGYGGDYVYLNEGKSGFTLKSQVGGGNVGVMIADVNGDGIPDIGTPYNGGVTLYLGNGDGTFQNGFELGGTGVYFLAENLHGQSPAAGLPDVVAPSGGVTVMINLTKGAHAK